MSPYANELAHARLEALRELIDAMREAEDPAEKRRCAVAIFNAPDPCDFDDEIELEDDEEADDEEADDQPETTSTAADAPTPGMSESVGGGERIPRCSCSAKTTAPAPPASAPAAHTPPSAPRPDP